MNLELIDLAASAATAAYIVAALLFVLSLAGLSTHETARRGLRFGIAGMVIALAATIVVTVTGGWGQPQAPLGLSQQEVGPVQDARASRELPAHGLRI